MKYSFFTLLLILCAASQDAQSATIERLRELNATGACQSALPVFDGNIRKRPRAVQNEGTSPAWITCSFTSDNPPATVEVFAASSDQQPHVLSCHGVPGYNGESTPAVVKSTDLPAPGNQNSLLWSPEDWAQGADEFPGRLFSISCALEPGAAITFISILFHEDIGS